MVECRTEVQQTRLDSQLKKNCDFCIIVFVPLCVSLCFGNVQILKTSSAWASLESDLDTNSAWASVEFDLGTSSAWTSVESDLGTIQPGQQSSPIWVPVQLGHQ